MKLKLIAGLFALLCAFASSAWAEKEADGHGIVKAVNTGAKTIKISHDAITGLNMSAMTMDFGVADPAMLADVKAGDEINFVVTQDHGGHYVVVDLEVVK